MKYRANHNQVNDGHQDRQNDLRVGWLGKGMRTRYLASPTSGQWSVPSMANVSSIPGPNVSR
jgi:hypothetical protein